MNELNYKILKIGETNKEILPEIYAIKLNKKKNKTPVAIVQFCRITTRLKPTNNKTFYSTKSYNDIHKIIKYYPSIIEFRNENNTIPFLNNCCWKDKIKY